MTMRRVVLGVSAAVFLAAGVAGCSSFRAAWQESRSGEIGREGWWRGDVTPSLIEAVRHGERVVVTRRADDGTYQVKIAPRTLTFPVPPSVIKVVSVVSTWINGETRTYAIPEGWTWERIHEWYLKWFDFKPTTGDRR